MPLIDRGDYTIYGKALLNDVCSTITEFVDERRFKVYSFEAESIVMAATKGRATETEAVKRCVCKIIDLLAGADISEDKVSSWSNDGVSQSYKTVSSDEYNRKIEEVIHTYLANEVDENGTPLLYLGVG